MRNNLYGLTVMNFKIFNFNVIFPLLFSNRIQDHPIPLPFHGPNIKFVFKNQIMWEYYIIFVLNWDFRQYFLVTSTNINRTHTYTKLPIQLNFIGILCLLPLIRFAFNLKLEAMDEWMRDFLNFVLLFWTRCISFEILKRKFHLNLL